MLYFDNLSPDTADDYLADGLTEALIDRLGRVERLVIRSRQTVLRFRGRTGGDPTALGRALNATYLVSGRVRRVGDRLRVGIELVHAATGTHLWGDHYDRTDADLFDIEADIARDVASAIAGRLLPAERRAVTTHPGVALDAYTLYLKGRFELNRLTPTRFRAAADYFKRAISADSTYAPAYAGLADAYNLLADYVPPRRLLPEMKAAAFRALELNPASAEAYTALGGIQLWFDWDPRAAEASFRRALSLNPNYAPAHDWYANTLLALGRNDEAMAAARRARELDPLAFGNAVLLFLYAARRHDLVIQEAQTALAMDSTNAIARLHLGMAFIQKGQLEEGLGHLHRAVAVDSSNTVVLGLAGYWAARAGSPEEARDVLRELSRRTAQQWVMPLSFAYVYAGLGEADSAFAWLERGLEDRAAYMIFLPVAWEWDPIRADPRFPALLRRMGLTP